MLLFTAFSLLPYKFLQLNSCTFRLQNSTLLNPDLNRVRCHTPNFLSSLDANLRADFRKRPQSALGLSAGEYISDFLAEESISGFDWDDQGQVGVKDDESPWKEAVIYRRNPSLSHIEYCTTLESLGLGNLSTEVSKSLASVMGLRVTKAVKDHPDGTPVLISLDVTRKKQKLRLDGIIRTVITVGCNRLQNSTLLNPDLNRVRCHTPNFLSSLDANLRADFRKRPQSALGLSAGEYISDFLAEESISGFDWDDQGQVGVKDDESPWKEAVIYRRNPSLSHIEYCTTLESLGLGNLSTEVSKSLASVMGLRVTKAVKDHPDGTPVLISLDVTRKKQKLRLDGIIRTVITVGCNRLQNSTLLNPDLNRVRCHTPNFLSSLDANLRADFRKRPQSALGLSAGEYISDFLAEESISGFDWDDQGQVGVKDDESPWKEAVIYRRNPSLSHIEYCTTLESLGLGNLSTEVSKSLASVMGLRVTKAVKDHPDGTPVLISLDVTRKKQKLRLDGIIRTVITVGCNRLQNSTLLNPDLNRVRCHTPNFLSSLDANLRADFRKRPQSALGLSAGEYISDFLAEESISGFDWDDQGQVGVKDDESPWKEAVIYRRNPSLSHIEYCTTLESLGLGNLSTEVSKSLASVMGLRVTKAVKDHPDGTPVLISLDVTRKKQKLRLDGIIRTVITVGCNRCGEPAAKSIFSNFSLLLTEEPTKELETINMGVIYGEENFSPFGNSEQEEEEDDHSIDVDDHLYFPPEEKEIDISKHIRDLVHVEITIDELCDPKCKGMCLRCGMNLNTKSCQCRVQKVDRKVYGPLGNLRKQM